MCRICFMTSEQEDILRNPCKCKGSLSFVHEKCLNQWLTSRNIRICELCKTRFVMQEEFGSLNYILRKNAKYLFGDKKKIILAAVYLFYLFLFGKRLINLAKYFKVTFFKFLQRVGLVTLSQIAKKTAVDPKQQLSLMKRFLLKLVKGMYFLYSLLIGTQLLVLGYGEIGRIKNMISFIINNSKLIRIKDGHEKVNQ